MAHVMKAARSQTGALTRHFERAKNDKGEFLKFSNSEIDTTKTHLNYNLAKDQNLLNFIKKRTSEVQCMNRREVNVMCSWVVTLPKEIKKENNANSERKFFEESYNFFTK